jgi:hypothetical protein
MAMLNPIRSLFSRADALTGYVYAPDADPGVMREAREGALVRIAGRGPPWIVVDFDPARIVIARWPGRLWRVSVIEAASVDDQRPVGGPPHDGVSYVRAISVRVLNLENPAVLFGERGAQILPLLDQAASLTRESAAALAAARNDNAAGAYDRAFRRWAASANIPVSDDDLDGALKIGGGSPVNSALTLLYNLVLERARAVDGNAALIETNDGDGLAQPWNGAAQAMCDAILARGAGAASEEDSAALLAAHARVFGEGGPALT